MNTLLKTLGTILFVFLGLVVGLLLGTQIGGDGSCFTLGYVGYEFCGIYTSLITGLVCLLIALFLIKKIGKR